MPSRNHRSYRDMNADDIVHILRQVTGDARGVDADDFLLASLNALPPEHRPEFWKAFRAALIQLWDSPVSAAEDQALGAAASFVARLPEDSRPESPTEVAGFLLSGQSGTDPSPNDLDRWNRIASALRILTHLGLGDVEFWRRQLKFWMEKGIVWQTEAGRIAALDGLVQAVRGVVAAEGMRQKDFLCLFNAALEAVEFPAIEVYSALVEETRKEANQQASRRNALPREIGEALSSFVRAIPHVSTSAPDSTHIQALHDVVSAWRMDEFGQPPVTVRPDTNTPPWQALGGDIDQRRRPPAVPPRAGAAHQV